MGNNKNIKLIKFISRFMIALGALAIIAVVAIGIYFIVIYIKLNNLGIKQEHQLTGTPVVTEALSANVTAAASSTSTPESTPAPEATPTKKYNQERINIMVIGCDTRSKGNYNYSRSDVNMILSIDLKNDEIKLITFMRDILIYYDELEDYQRLNYAIPFYNHPDGLVRTIEENFGIEIDHYMITDFWGMEDLIDIFDGIEVSITDDEISATNDVLAHQNKKNGDNVSLDFLPHEPGNLKMTGRQAVAYMRIRKLDTCMMRIDRQFKVMQYIKSRLQDMTIDEVIKILNKLPDMMATDMNADEILSLTKLLYSMKDYELQTQRFPFDGTYEPGWYKSESTNNKSIWIWEYDYEENIDLLHEYIYE